MALSASVYGFTSKIISRRPPALVRIVFGARRLIASRPRLCARFSTVDVLGFQELADAVLAPLTPNATLFEAAHWHVDPQSRTVVDHYGPHPEARPQCHRLAVRAEQVGLQAKLGSVRDLHGMLDVVIWNLHTDVTEAPLSGNSQLCFL